jgi:tRNA A37 threonylcarbamoyladenosine modification protein TsaB
MIKSKIEVDIIIISLSTPLKIGIYQNGKFMEEIITTEKTSQILPSIFKELLKRFIIKNICYTNGPGSFMSVKVVYLFIITLSKVFDIKIYSSLGFNFNNNSPIKALGKKYFIKQSEKENKITIDFLENRNINIENIENFNLPKTFNIEKYSKNIEPNYMIEAIH